MKLTKKTGRGKWFLITIGGVMAAFGCFQLYNFYAMLFDFGLMPPFAIGITILGFVVMFGGIKKASIQSDRRQ